MSVKLVAMVEIYTDLHALLLYMFSIPEHKKIK